jgi:hypothetical protein
MPLFAVIVFVALHRTQRIFTRAGCNLRLNSSAQQHQDKNKFFHINFSPKKGEPKPPLVQHVTLRCAC